MGRFRFFVPLCAMFLPLLFKAPPLSAQVITEAPLSETLETSRVPLPPVASGLQAKADGASVTLTWQPFQGQQDKSVILRHTAPIAISNYAQAETIAELEAGETRFVDFPEESGSFYYAVIPRGAETGELQPFFVPSENSLVFPVEIAAAEAEAQVRVSFFDVILKNQAVVISWETEPYDSNVVIYRSTQPFEGITALAQASIVAASEEAVQPYVDYPVPGVPYYYAVVPESAVRSGGVVFGYGENTNEIPVEVPGEYAGIPSTTARAAVRDIPLPLLNPLGTTQAPPAAFSAETEEIIAAFNASTARRNAPQEESLPRDVPYRFPEDTAGGSGGEEAALKGILDTYFEGEAWAELEAELSRFLSLRRTDEVAARARFYLGEAYYFMGDYSQALAEFLLTRDAYPAKAGEWIQKVLKRL